MFRKRGAGAPTSSRRLKLNKARQQGRGGDKGHPKSVRKSMLRDCCTLCLAFLLPILIMEIWDSVIPKDSNWLEKLQNWIPSTANTTFAVVSTETPINFGGGLTKPPTADNKPAILSTAPPKPVTKTSTTANQKKLKVAPDKTIAYVVPFFTQCNQHIQKLRDAAMVLRHSIHLQSAQTPESGSKYGYQMYALVVKDHNCPKEALEALGYKVHEVTTPMDPTQIQSNYVRDNLERGNLDGGLDSYIQLLAYELVEEPIFVLLYINTLVLKPLDTLFQAMQYDKGTLQGGLARQTLQNQLERPGEELPAQIHHFFVRDYPNTAYNRKPVIHTPGFLVAVKAPHILTDAVHLFQKADYVDRDNGVTSGWGGKGYTLYFKGGLTMPGFYAYFLDTFHSATIVELNGCIYNHNGMDNRFRKPPRFHPSASEHIGKCRSGEEQCGDCTTTELASIYTVLYDETCFDPWKCYGEGEEGGTQRAKINTELTPLDHCMMLQHEWHLIRHGIEIAFAKHHQSAEVARGARGTYILRPLSRTRGLSGHELARACGKASSRRLVGWEITRETTIQKVKGPRIGGRRDRGSELSAKERGQSYKQQTSCGVESNERGEDRK